jgi:hypothetical protein
MTLHDLTPPPPETAPAEAASLDLRGFSYDERRAILPAVTAAVSSGGCWLKERRAVSFSQVEFRFEMQVRAAIDLYSALIAAGLELTQDTHAELTGLCTLRRHNHRLHDPTSRLLSVRLEVSFLEETAFELAPSSIGLA